MWTVRWIPRDSYKLPDAPLWLPMPSDREQYSLTEAEPFHCPRPKVLHQHVGARDELAHDICRLRPLQV